MNFSELLKSSFYSLRSNGRRTFLTMFGIIVGITSVIIVMSLGNGFQREAQEQLTKNTSGEQSVDYFFTPNNFESNYRSEEVFSLQNQQDIENIDGVNHVKIVYQQPRKEIQAFNTTIGGESNTFQGQLIKKESPFSLLSGRQLTKVDNDSQQRYVMIGDSIAKAEYGSAQDAINESIEIEDTPFTIVGVFDDKTDDISSAKMSNAFSVGQMPHLLMTEGGFDRMNEMKSSSSGRLMLEVYFDKDANIQVLTQKISNYLERQGNANSYGRYSFIDLGELMDNINNTLGLITLFIAAVAGISLFIAGVGVMNMMYINVSERTKEIGIRRSLGATAKSIRNQFLIEGVVITTIGGLIGYILGALVGLIISQFLPFPAIMNIKTALVAVIISMLIGIVFSVFPAQSAVKKNVVDILK